VDLPGLLDHLAHRQGVGDRTDVRQCRTYAVGGEDLGLDLARGVADPDPHHEPVELRLGQRIGPLVLDRVLRRDHHEGRTELVGLGVDRDLTLLHALQERRLGLGARAVDLVPEHDVREDRTGLELEVPALLVEDVHAGDVGRQQVRA
jgi:hypothetical protein